MARAPEIQSIDVGAGRKDLGVVRPAVDDGDRVVLQGPVQLFRHVVRAQGVLEAQVETVASGEHPVALRPVDALPGSGAAPEHIHGDVLRQVPHEGFPPASGPAIRDEPSGRPVFGLQIRQQGRTLLMLLIGGGRFLARWEDALDPPVRLEAHHVRIPAVRHGPVEVSIEVELQAGQVRVERGLVVEEDKLLFLGPPAGRGEVVRVQIPGVEEEGTAPVEQTPIRRRETVGDAAAGLEEGLPPRSHTEIRPFKVLGPVEDYDPFIAALLVDPAAPATLRHHPSSAPPQESHGNLQKQNEESALDGDDDRSCRNFIELLTLWGRVKKRERACHAQQATLLIALPPSCWA